MINNEVLKRVRFILALNEAKLQQVFEAADHPVKGKQLESWLDKDGAENYTKLEDVELATFLNGLINFKRGKKEGEQPVPETKLNNNMIFKKLKIAFDMKNDEVLEILSSADCKISAHELTAQFRKKNHKHFRVCKDEVLFAFLNGLKLKFRDETESKPV